MSRISRIRRLGREQQGLLVRTAVVLTAASFAVAALPFHRAIRFGSIRVRRSERASVADCVWAIEAAARRLPWRTMCIEKGLAAQRLLRARGCAAVLHYGVRHHPGSGKLEAHVWVTADGQTIIGGAEAQEFAEVATFP